MSADSSVTSIEGALIVPEGAKFAIVGARFNAFIVERLIEGAVDALVRLRGRSKRLQSMSRMNQPT